MSLLFTPNKLGPHQLDNRIIVAPMCQYSAQDGIPTSWHTMHYGQLALSGAALVIIEATAVEPRGRISYKDLGLWSEEHGRALKQLISDIKQHTNAKIGIQLAHAGRKASTSLPWEGGKSLAPDDENGWQKVAPSSIAFGQYHQPQALTIDEIEKIKTHLLKQLKELSQQVLMLLRYMVLMVIYCMNSYHHYQTIAPISMAVILIIVVAC